MRYAHITVDGVNYTLRESESGQWMITNRAPYSAGEYPITVTVTTAAGQKVTIDVDDPELNHALTLIATEDATVSGERMLSYYPQVIRQILEFQAIIKTHGFEVDFLKNDVELIVNDAYLSTMGESRIVEWEKFLGITPASDNSLQDRREVIIARIRGKGKLNTALINSVVRAFTGGTAISYVEDSTLYVKITPPPGNKQYKFDNVVAELSLRVPAHLGLVVKRNYATWGDLKDNHANWEAIKQFADWDDVMLYIPPQ